jgi:transcriptional regulator with XRE-family HTH domain
MRGGDPGFDVALMVVQIRRHVDLSQRDLARLSGVAQSTISAIESGERGVQVKVFARLVSAAGMKLAVLDPDGKEVTPFVAGAARDNAGRRFPAHLDVRPPDDIPEERITSPRYDRGEAKGWYHLRGRRDLLREGGEAPDRHPTAGELEYRRLRKLHGRSPWWPRREAQLRRTLGVAEDPSATD